MYYALCDNMDWEYKTNKHIRDRETDINGYLRERHKELMEPLLYVALFDTERNDAAKKGWKEQVKTARACQSIINLVESSNPS